MVILIWMCQPYVDSNQSGCVLCFVLKSILYADETRRDSPPTAGEGECSGSESYDSCGKRGVQRLDQIWCYIDFFNSACRNNVLCQQSRVDLISRGMKYDSSKFIWIQHWALALSWSRCMSEVWENSWNMTAMLKYPIHLVCFTLDFWIFDKWETKDSSALTRFISESAGWYLRGYFLRLSA